MKRVFRIPALDSRPSILVSFATYDVLGHEVKTLVDEARQAGLYEVTWDSSETVCGIYFYLELWAILCNQAHGFDEGTISSQHPTLRPTPC